MIDVSTHSLVNAIDDTLTFGVCEIPKIVKRFRGGDVPYFQLVYVLRIGLDDVLADRF